MPAAPIPNFENERLSALSALHILDTARTTTFDNLASIAADIMRTPIAAISLVAERRQWFKALFGLPGVTETPRDLAFCAYTILDPDRAMVVEDALCDPRVADNELVTGSPYIRSYAGAPLLVGDNTPIGALCVIDTKPRTFSRDDLARLQDLARVVSKSLKLHGSVLQLRHKNATSEH